MKKILFLIFTLFLLSACNDQSDISKEIKTETVKQNQDSQQENINQINNETNDSVPLPRGEDIIRTFFALINEKKAAEAVMIMTAKNTSDDSTKQAWGVQFNAIKSIEVTAIEPNTLESWTDNSQSYKVTLDVSMSADAANAPMPYYGWDEGTNIRWIYLIKEGNLWKIDDIATGP